MDIIDDIKKMAVFRRCHFFNILSLKILVSLFCPTTFAILTSTRKTKEILQKLMKNERRHCS